MAKKRGNNEGSITRRSSGSWRAQVTIDGKRLSFGATSKAECQVWLNQTLDQVIKGMDLLGGKIALSEYVEQWIKIACMSLRPKTVIQYEQIVRSRIIPGLGMIPLNDLRPERVEKFYFNLLEKGTSARTVRLTHAVLHRALEKAVNQGLIYRNPAKGATIPKLKQAEMKVFDEGQVSQFLVSAHGGRNEALYHLSVITGMRQGELLGLKWSDLQWSSGTLYVRRQMQSIRGLGYVFSEPKTKAGRRTIRLREATLQILLAHRDRQGVEINHAKDRWQDHDLIFPSSIGTPMNSSNVQKDFRKTLERAGLPRIRFHDLRHTAASLMLNHGVPVIVVSKILGHSKPSVTLDIYGHLYTEMQDEAAKIMEEIVTPVPVQFTKTEDDAQILESFESVAPGRTR